MVSCGVLQQTALAQCPPHGYWDLPVVLDPSTPMTERK